MIRRWWERLRAPGAEAGKTARRDGRRAWKQAGREQAALEQAVTELRREAAVLAALDAARAGEAGRLDALASRLPEADLLAHLHRVLVPGQAGAGVSVAPCFPAAAFAAIVEQFPGDEYFALGDRDVLDLPLTLAPLPVAATWQLVDQLVRRALPAALPGWQVKGTRLARSGSAALAGAGAWLAIDLAPGGAGGNRIVATTGAAASPPAGPALVGALIPRS